MKLKTIKLDTAHTSLIFTESNGRLAITHYGKKVADGEYYNTLECDPFVSGFCGSSDQYLTANMPYSSVGDGNSAEHLLAVLNSDGSYVNRFEYVNCEYVDGGAEIELLPCAHGAAKTMILTFADKHAKLTLKQFYTVFDDCDVIAVRQTLTNDGEKAVSVKRLMSLQLDINGTGHKCVSFHGAWTRERYRKEADVTAGTYAVQSMAGTTSAMSNPFIMLKKRNSDGILAFNLIYSGNHREVVEAHTALINTRILVGMNDYCFDWTLEPGMTFETPQAIMLFALSEREVTEQMHKFVMRHIVDPNFADRERPVLFNNWEGTGFDFNEEKLLNLAQKAKDIGAELFVLDDGWFGQRNDDYRGLGDWFDNKEKLNGGLDKLSDNIRKLGLKFGIWVEPEMVNEDSDLYREHPEYAMTVPGREPIRRRHQLMLDLVNPEVQQYIIEAIGDVIARCKAYYVKWDCNRFMSDMYSPVLNNMGEYYHKYVLGLYKILIELKKRFPDVLFESCASGGCRFDLGLLKYMPQAWCSDMSEATHRVRIQEGTLYAYPQSTIGAHVSLWPNTSYETKFNVACLGAFGYELDITASSQETLDIMKAQIDYYKKHRKLLQFGRYNMLESVFAEEERSSWIIFAEDKSEAIAFIGATRQLHNSPTLKWRFSGFDDNAVYSIEVREQAHLKRPNFIKQLRGDVLNNCDLDFGRIFADETDRGMHTTPLATRLIYFKRISG